VTAPDAVPEGTTVAELAAALRRDAEGDRAREAAIGLLIAHRSGGQPGPWLRREPFLALVRWDPADDLYPAEAEVDWAALRQLLASGEGLLDTGSERAVLRVAVELAVGSLAVAASSCDEHNRRLICAAVDAAMGGSA
jgi:hypothetical protein